MAKRTEPRIFCAECREPLRNSPSFGCPKCGRPSESGAGRRRWPRVSRRTAYGVALALSALQLVAMFIAVATTYGLGMQDFDDPGCVSPRLLDAVAASAWVLMQPGMWSLSLYPNGDASYATEWVIFGLNSLLWGFTGAAVLLYA